MRKIKKALINLGDKKTSIIDKLYLSDGLDWAFKTYYSVNNFIFKVRRSLSYAKKSWGMYDFDYSSSLLMFEFALERTEQAIKNGYSANADKTVKKCKIMRNLLRRISKDEDTYDYIFDDLHKKYGENEWNFVPYKNGLVTTRNTNPKYDSIEYKKDFKRALEKR